MATRTSLDPRKMPRQARSQQTVAAIVQAAAQVFQRHGYAAGTTDRIAERAGVSIGSLYQYFPNKDALLVALGEWHIAEGFTRMREVLAQVQAEQPTVEVMLRMFVEAMIALHAHEPELHRVLFEEAPLPASLRRTLREGELAFAAEVQSVLQAIPDLALPRPAMTAYLLVQTVEGLVHRFVLHPPSNLDVAMFTDELVHLLRRYLTA